MRGRSSSSPGPRIKLPKGPHDAEFWAAYKSHLGSEPPAPRTFDVLIAAYKASPEFTNRSVVTQRDYARYLDIVCTAWGKNHVGSLRPKHVNTATTVILGPPELSWTTSPGLKVKSISVPSPTLTMARRYNKKDTSQSQRLGPRQNLEVHPRAVFPSGCSPHGKWSRQHRLRACKTSRYDPMSASRSKAAIVLVTRHVAEVPEVDKSDSQEARNAERNRLAMPMA
jgi:hypothetical protein